VGAVEVGRTEVVRVVVDPYGEAGVERCRRFAEDDLGAGGLAPVQEQDRLVQQV
jgi:hypothetical protein